MRQLLFLCLVLQGVPESGGMVIGDLPTEAYIRFWSGHGTTLRAFIVPDGEFVWKDQEQ